MPTYATQAQCENEIEGLTVNDPAAFARVIERAERDIDRAVGIRPVDSVTGRKFDPTTMEAVQRDALMRATAAQVEFRIAMGDRFFIRPQHESSSGPDYSVTGKLQRIGPKAMEELELSGLFRLSTTWGGHNDSDPPWHDFTHNTDLARWN